MNNKLFTGLIMLIAILIWQTRAIAQEKDNHEGHDHSIHQEDKQRKIKTETHAEHFDDDKDKHAEEKEQDKDDDHAEHANEEKEEKGLEVELSDQAIKMVGLSLAKIESKKLKTNIRLTGEVGFNQDRLVHVVPRFPGIATTILKKLGENVKAEEIVAKIESNESLALFDVKSLISGTIVEKHVSLGEFVTDSEPIFVIADLNKVWINLAIYPKDIGKVKIGQTVNIQVIGNPNKTTGKISYVGKVFDEATRFVTARVVIPNKDHKWLPGMFVSGIIEQEGEKSFNVVENEAIQTINEKQYVFLPESSNTFHAVEVKTGQTDNQFTQIISGLKPGQKYVVKGAFELKSKIVISAQGDSHAGHGH